MNTPTNCQHCNQPFAHDADDRPVYKTLPFFRNGQPPITHYLCSSCWSFFVSYRPKQPPIFRTENIA